MKGYVTWLTALAFILVGLGESLLAYLQPDAGTSADRGIEHVLTGLGLIGIGRKLDRAALPK